MYHCDEQKSPLPAQPVSTACGATAAGEWEQEERREHQTNKEQKGTTHTQTHEQNNPTVRNGMQKREGEGGECRKQETK